MKRTAQPHRLATAAFVAAALAPSHLVLAQETTPPPARPDPLATERPVTLPPATSSPVTTPSTTTTQPTATQPIVPAPLPKATGAPLPASEAAQPSGTRQAARRTAAPTRSEATPRRPAATSAASSPAPAAEATAAAPPAESAPAPAAPVAAPAEAPSAPPAETPADRNLLWLIGAGALALLALLAAVMLFRRRRARGELSEEAYEQPVVTPEPVMAAAPAEEPAVEPMPASAFAPVAAIPLPDQTAPDRTSSADEPAIEPARVTVAAADAADTEAVATGSQPAAGRPWLEFFLRPTRAGIDEEAATVEFDLVVGNTGSEPARDVRVSAFMFASGSAAESEMERMLIEPPGGGGAELALDPGAAARVEGMARLPKQSFAGEVLPVVVADARYRLPDGSEGVMRAAFEVGRAEGDSPAPFRADPPAGLTGEVVTRLHGEVERV